jgi:hypothetical protein
MLGTLGAKATLSTRRQYVARSRRRHQREAASRCRSRCNAAHPWLHDPVPEIKPCARRCHRLIFRSRPRLERVHFCIVTAAAIRLRSCFRRPVARSGSQTSAVSADDVAAGSWKQPSRCAHDLPRFLFAAGELLRRRSGPRKRQSALSVSVSPRCESCMSSLSPPLSRWAISAIGRRSVDDGDQPETLLDFGHYPEAGMRRWNRDLLAACRRHPNMCVFDWAAVVKRPWFIPDGIHYGAPGPRRAPVSSPAVSSMCFPRGQPSSSSCLVK